jgi:hypothetical protein
VHSAIAEFESENEDDSQRSRTVCASGDYPPLVAEAVSNGLPKSTWPCNANHLTVHARSSCTRPEGEKRLRSLDRLGVRGNRRPPSVRRVARVTRKARSRYCHRSCRLSPQKALI